MCVCVWRENEKERVSTEGKIGCESLRSGGCVDGCLLS